MPYKRKRSRSYPGANKRRKSTRVARFGRYRKTYRRRTRKVTRNPRSGASAKSVKFPLTGFPKRLVMSLPFRTYGYYTTQSLGASDFHTYRLNSLYDPDLTAVGTQPLYFDQITSISGLYRRYLVYRTDVEVVFRNKASSDVQVWCVTDTVDNGAAWTPTQVFSYGERPKWHTKMLETPGTGGPLSRHVYRASFHMASVFGITKSKLYAEDDYSAPFNNNPSKVAFLTTGVCDDPYEQTQGLTCDVEIYMRFHVVFYDNGADPAQS